MKALAALVERHLRLFLASALLLLVALAWHNRFVQDDAFIAFRYARHLVEGHGLVFNPGERVEGYTCFLYVLMIAAAMIAGIDPVAAAHAIGLAAFVGSLASVYMLARRLAGDRVVALVAMVLLGTNYSFSAYATGGLETQLQTCLITAFLAIAVGELSRPAPRPAALAAASLLAALALMTRMDSVLLLLPMGAALAWRVAAVGGRPGARAAGLAALIAPVALLIGGWMVWKVGYYGSLVPNTFYAKVGGHLPYRRGLFYFSQFLTSTWLVGPLFVAVAMRRDLLAAGGLAARLLLGTALLWITYLVCVGGDFMEFRMLVPVLPLAFAFLALTVALLERRAGLGWALALLTLIGSAHHAVTYPWGTHADRNESVYELNAHLFGPGEDWIGSGRVLRQDLGGDSTVVIATTAAGAIPFYSGLVTIDMLGLCDPWVARHGDSYTNVPGHRRVATMDYLMERRVTLVIAHPTPPRKRAGPVCIEDFTMVRFAAGEPLEQRFPPGMSAVEIPVSPGLRMLAYYLTPHPRVEEAIRSKGWRRRDIALCFAAP